MSNVVLGFIERISPRTYNWMCEDFKIPAMNRFFCWLERQLRKPGLICTVVWAVLMGKDLGVRSVTEIKRTELPAVKRPENLYAPIAVFLVNMQKDLHAAISKTEKGRSLISKQGDVLLRCNRAKIPIIAITRPKGGEIIPKLKGDGKIGKSVELGDGKLLPDLVWRQLEDHEIKTAILMGVDADGNLQSMAEQLMGKGYKVLLCAELAMNGPEFTLKAPLLPYQWFSKKGCFHQYLSSIWDYIR